MKKNDLDMKMKMINKCNDEQSLSATACESLSVETVNMTV